MPDSIPRFAVSVHNRITQAANDQKGAFDAQELAWVLLGNDTQDVHQTDSKLHFDNCNFEEGAAYIATQWQAVQYYRSKSPQACLLNFGQLLHTVQDFYAHSNWVELHLNVSPVPVWDLVPATLPAQIVSGTWVIGSPKKCSSGAPTHDQLNKDDEKSSEGSKMVAAGPNSGQSYFSLAYDAALRASLIQFERFMAGGAAPRAMPGEKMSLDLVVSLAAQLDARK